jgi:hypothetical protein
MLVFVGGSEDVGRRKGRWEVFTRMPYGGVCDRVAEEEGREIYHIVVRSAPGCPSVRRLPRCPTLQGSRGGQGARFEETPARRLFGFARIE